jgi:hypothetical protein
MEFFLLVFVAQALACGLNQMKATPAEACTIKERFPQWKLQ